MELYLLFALTVAGLALVPGPNVAVIVSLSLAHGVRAGLISVAGTTTGLALQLLLVVAGYAILIEVAATLFSALRWVGVFILIFFGLSMIFCTGDDAPAPADQGRRSFLLGLMTALLNPKTLMFNAALLAPFISLESQIGAISQLLIYASIYLGVIGICDTGWVLFARGFHELVRRYRHFMRWATGGLLVGGGVMLAMARRE